MAQNSGRDTRSAQRDAARAKAREIREANKKSEARRRYGFIAGLGGEAAAPAWSSPDYVAAYEASWELGNALAIETDPRG